jgi:outer membrane receptor protein involved in Fe transport
MSYDVAMSKARYIDRSDRVELELQHTLRRGTAHIVTTGAMFRESRPVSDGTYLTDGPTGEKIRIDESGAYVGYDNLSIPKLRLSGVARYDTHSDFSERFSPKLSAVYTRDNGHTLRLIYNEAFNSPNFYLLYAKSAVGRDAAGYTNWIRGNRSGYTFVNLKGGAVPAPIKALEPLHVSSLELGYRATLGTKASLDVTAYRTAYRNYISKEATIGSSKDSIFAVDPRTGLPLKENTRTYINYGELPVTGVELSADWIPSERWNVDAVFAYQQPGTFRKPVAGLTPPGFNAPTHKLKGSVAYRDFLMAGSRLEVSAIRISKFDFLSSLAYLTGPVPEYTTADVQATIPLFTRTNGRTRLHLAVRNLFDRVHIETPGGAPLGRLASLSLSADW